MPSYPGVGDRIGRFRVLAQLGAGGMGVVYDALEENLDRRVALKVIAPLYADDPAFRERFSREARSLASLDSPHVVQVYAHGEEDGYLYIATQLIPDGDLGQMVGRWGPAPLGKAAQLIEQVASGLADAHAAGLVHRDIKPANVLVRRRGSGAETTVSAYLGDFGIARKADAEATRVGGAGAVGTPSYMAPELHHGAPATAASDLYSLGCLLWVTLTGSPPYAGGTEFEVISAHLQAPIPQVSGASVLVQELNRVLQRAMAKSPADRYHRATELRDDLRRAASLSGDPAFYAQARPLVGTPTPAPVDAAPTPTPASAPMPTFSSGQAPRRTGLWIGVGVAALLAIGGGVSAALVAGGSDDPDRVGDRAGTETAGTETAGPGEPAFADQSSEDILRAAEKEMKVLDTVRIAGDVVADGELLGVDLTITSRGECDGVISSGGGSAQLRRVGSDTWFLADEEFWIYSTDATQGPIIAAAVGGRWVLVPPDEADEFASVCDLDELLESTDDTVAGENLGPDSIDGRDVVKVDTGGTGGTGAGGDTSVAFVAVTDPHYILKLDGGLDGSFTFSAFDEPFSAEPPPADEVFDLEGFGG
ncbi:hypothetical protein BH09ACT12_BH09ACT12_22430 [soil metagenome]